MKELLTSISTICISKNSEEMGFTSSQIKSAWLGRQGAKNEEITKAEEKLGVHFPEDYKQFLIITNGFDAPNSTTPSFMNVNEIDYLENLDPSLTEIWIENGPEDIGRELQRSIIVGGKNEEQYFLLIPPDSLNKNWKYWSFSNWQPGEVEYENLEEYFREVLDFEQNYQ